MRILSRSIEDKKLVWFEQGNNYVRMEDPAFEVFCRLNDSLSTKDITTWCSDKYDLDPEEAERFVTEVRQFIELNNTVSAPPSPVKFPVENRIPSGNSIITRRYYRFAGAEFCFEYGHERIEQMIHPLMAHLEVFNVSGSEHLFQLFRLDNKLYLRTNDTYIGEWEISGQHYFKGKVFLELLNKAYGKEEDDWMAVLHASAVSYGDRAVLFAGSSGSGKSTILSILLASGFDFLADDFVPLDAKGGEVYPFPVAISVKEGAVDILKEKYPELADAETYIFEAAGKKVKYMSPGDRHTSLRTGIRVGAMVFVDYRPAAETLLEPFSLHEAIPLLVTESWVSKKPENVERFLDWIGGLSCYRLTYSDNEEMKDIIQKLFDEKV